jgi:hypothetical protein
MRERIAIGEGARSRVGVALAAAVLLPSAGLAAELARAHMASLGVICGGAHPHCGWCYAAAGLFLMGLAAGAAAMRPGAAPARRRAG